jgi:hypothetical protein
VFIKDNIYGNVKVNDKIIEDLINSKCMQRLKCISNVGIPKKFLPKNEPDFTRYEHSVGVMLILRRLGAPLEEQVAGLLHDVSHTAFSHISDYVINKDGAKEDYQDSIHYRFFTKGGELSRIITTYKLDPKRISEPKNYGLLEQEQPELCADRFDYTLRWYWNFDKDFVKDAVNSITSKNGLMVFRSKNIAIKFAKAHIRKFGESRYGPKYDLSIRWYIFSSALKIALNKDIITIDDFSNTDTYVMKKIESSKDKEIEHLFKILQKSLRFKYSNVNPKIVLHTKFRYTNPMFIEGKNLYRVTDVNSDYKERIAKDKTKNKIGLGIKYIKGINLPIV